MSSAWSKIYLESSEPGGTSADSLDRSPGSLDTSRGPEMAATSFGDGLAPGLSIDQIPPIHLPLFRSSKNLPVVTPVYQSVASGLRYPLRPAPCQAGMFPARTLAVGLEWEER